MSWRLLQLIVLAVFVTGLTTGCPERPGKKDTPKTDKGKVVAPAKAKAKAKLAGEKSKS